MAITHVSEQKQLAKNVEQQAPPLVGGSLGPNKLTVDVDFSTNVRSSTRLIVPPCRSSR